MNENMGSIITLLILGGFSVIESVLSFMEKGIPLNNYYNFLRARKPTVLIVG